MDSSYWRRLQAIDRRYIYGLLLLSILGPLFAPKFTVPIVPSQQTQDFYDTIERLARTEPNKLIIIDGWWSPSTRGENQWQTQAILTHLMKRHLRFAFLSWDPQNNTVTQGLVDQLAPKFGYVYGRDYVNWGYRPAAVFGPTLKALVQSVPGAIKKDYKGAPLSQIPVMNSVQTMKDIGAVVEITPSGTVDTWIGLVQGAYNTPILFAPTAVMAPTYYPYLDSGQLSGMLTGVKGAGEYESLIGTRAFGTRATAALSLVYGLLIFLIILGNVGYFATRKERR